MLRQALINIRKISKGNRQKYFAVTGTALAILIGIAVIIDSLLPFEGWLTLLRSALVIPISLLMFSFGYALSVFLYEMQMQKNDDWVPFRLRFSLNWRRRIAIIAGAIIFLFIYATSPSPLYTTMSSAYIAIILAVLAFIRPTNAESIREELNIPDVRDIKYEEHMKNVQKDREKARRDKKKKKTEDEEEDF